MNYEAQVTCYYHQRNFMLGAWQYGQDKKQPVYIQGKVHSIQSLEWVLAMHLILCSDTVLTLWLGWGKNHRSVAANTVANFPNVFSKVSGFVAINTAGKNPDILPKISSGSHLTYVETPPRAVVSHVKAWRWWWWLPNCSKTWNTAKIVWAGKGFKTQIMQSWTIIFNPAALNSYKSAWWVKYLQHRSLKTSNFQRNLSTLWNHCY